MKIRSLPLLITVFVLFAQWTSRAQTWTDFSAPSVVHIKCIYSPTGGATERTFFLVDGNGQKTVIASTTGWLYDTYRIPMDSPPLPSHDAHRHEHIHQ